MSRRILLAITLLIGISTAVWAICLPNPCPSGQPYQTPWVWGFGPTCEDAENDALAQAFNHAVSRCGRPTQVCNFQLVPNPCFWSTSHQAYQVDAYAKHNCTSCTESSFP